MGSFLAGLEGRSWLASVLVIGLGILLTGELSVVAAFPGGKRWLSSWMGKVVAFLFYLLLYLPSFAVFGFWSSQFLEPELLAPPASSSDYFMNGLLFGASTSVLIPALAVFRFTYQFTKTSLTQPSAAPTILGTGSSGIRLQGLFWVWSWVSSSGRCSQTLTCSQRSWSGILLGNPSAASADASIPILQRPLVLSLWGTGGSFGLVAGLITFCYRWLRWWKNGGLWKPFPLIGAALIGAGCVIVAVSAWLIA